MLDDAPAAFQFPVSPSVRAGIFVSAVCLAAALVVLGWSWPLRHTGLIWQLMLSWMAGLLCLLASIQAFRQWRHSPSGHLLWLSHGWAWQGGLAPAQVLHVSALDCVWDGQTFVLLRVQWTPAQVSKEAQRQCLHWLWLDQSMAPALWGDMRRAMLHWRQRVQR